MYVVGNLVGLWNQVLHPSHDMAQHFAQKVKKPHTRCPTPTWPYQLMCPPLMCCELALWMSACTITFSSPTRSTLSWTGHAAGVRQMHGLFFFRTLCQRAVYVEDNLASSWNQGLCPHHDTAECFAQKDKHSHTQGVPPPHNPIHYCEAEHYPIIFKLHLHTPIVFLNIPQVVVSHNEWY